MTTFIVLSSLLFLLSIVTNIIFIMNEHTQNKGGAVFGLMVFTIMFSWSIFLLFS